VCALIGRVGGLLPVCAVLGRVGGLLPVCAVLGREVVRLLDGGVNEAVLARQVGTPRIVRITLLRLANNCCIASVTQPLARSPQDSAAIFNRSACVILSEPKPWGAKCELVSPSTKPA